MESLVNKSSPSWAFAKERGFSVWCSFSATSNPFTWSRYTHIVKDKVFSVKIKGHEQGHTKDWWLHEGSGLSVTRCCCPLCARHCAEWEMGAGETEMTERRYSPLRNPRRSFSLLPSSVAPVRVPRDLHVAKTSGRCTVLTWLDHFTQMMTLLLESFLHVCSGAPGSPGLSHLTTYCCSCRFYSFHWISNL